MKPKPLSVRSMFGAQSRVGAVVLRLGEEVVQLPPGQAREVGQWLIEAAEAADGDAALFAVCKKMELDDRLAVLILRELRASRAAPKGHNGWVDESEAAP